METDRARRGRQGEGMEKTDTDASDGDPSWSCQGSRELARGPGREGQTQGTGPGRTPQRATATVLDRPRTQSEKPRHLQTSILLVPSP